MQPVAELLSQLVAIEEVREVGRRLPVLESDRGFELSGEAMQRDPSHQVVGWNRSDRMVLLGEHAVDTDAGALGSAHHRGEAGFDLLAARLDGKAIDRASSVLAEVCGDGRWVEVRPSGEEVEDLAKVALVVLAGASVLGERERLDGSR